MALHRFLLLLVILFRLYRIRAQDGLVMDPVEKEAFYQVMEFLNHESDWRGLVGDPCGENTLQGMSCDTVGSNSSYIYITSLSFGQIQMNTPSCSSNASIHPDISKLVHLKSLSFYRCFMVSPAHISPSLGLLTSLQSLTFQDNPALVGEIPVQLGSIVSLERMIVTGNALTGRIPEELGGLSSIKQLVISRNTGILGRVPGSLGKCTALVILDLSGNRLDSELPRELGLLRNLKKLDVSSNWVTGTLLSSLVQGLLSLELMDLSRNRLNGTFPSALLSLQNLKELYMNENQITGRLPTSWGKMDSLISLDLSRQVLEGPIPAGLGTVKSLRYLGLNKNNFTGRIPRELSVLGDLSEINLSDNSLSGPVPFNLETVKRLGRKIKLDNNAGLCFPGGISMLLSSNSSDFGAASGLIPCDETTNSVEFNERRGLPNVSSSRFKHVHWGLLVLFLFIL